NRAARRTCWLVLVDLDQDATCAPEALRTWMPSPAPGMCLRIAVRAVESWILADHERLASFLAVSRGLIPRDPDRLGAPKRQLVDLARQSRSGDIREDLVPRPGSGRAVGAAYASRLIEFVGKSWRPRTAAQRSDSLRRCLQGIRVLAKSGF